MRVKVRSLYHAFYQWLVKQWYSPRLSFFMLCLLPFSYLFCIIIYLRRELYQRNWIASYRLPCPVMIVGNITVGGTGKTPFLMMLAECLSQLGWKVGIIMRGVGKEADLTLQLVTDEDTTSQVGDEAMLIYQRLHLPIAVSSNRVEAAKMLINQKQCNFILSDDGLQHYRLKREGEWIIVDGERRFGNGCLLPSGPLREPLSRLSEADFIIVNGGSEKELSFDLVPVSIYSLTNPSHQVGVSEFMPRKIHAVAGIGNPMRFFEMLKKLGFELLETRAFPDHHIYTDSDLTFDRDAPILMTEKDSVKCAKMNNSQLYALKVEVKCNAKLELALNRWIAETTEKFTQ